ncbi:hypothetical protein [Rhodococcus sp. B10]|uniref:hypothetical protein n=1 Tax=Rhodococcus sp. B10 TaxID=2695876 RepID=UPI001430FCBC|nr:hypothetical protein [Rhodococcus sp. B10]NIL77650.1 hypothetical protein [Rhodococcus sp. B10]
MRRQWWPDGARRVDAKTRPDVGDIIGHDYQPWRVMEVRDSPLRDGEQTWCKPYMLHLRPAQLDTWRTAMDEDIHGRVVDTLWPILGEHYPVCVKCGDLTPCREVVSVKIAAESAENAARYETAGVCPACEEVVTRRQQAVTWQENVVAVLGPPVTFHLRQKCFWGAYEYEQKWSREYPDRPLRFHCGGDVVNHGDGTYECTHESACPGPSARHRSMSVCRDCCSPRPRDCHPKPDAVNRFHSEPLHPQEGQ